MEYEVECDGSKWRFSVDAMENRLLECGYTTRWQQGRKHGLGWHRVELESPYHRGDYTAGEGKERQFALADALSAELQRLSPELRALVLQGFETTEEGTGD